MVTCASAVAFFPASSERNAESEITSAQILQFSIRLPGKVHRDTALGIYGTERVSFYATLLFWIARQLRGKPPG